MFKELTTRRLKFKNINNDDVDFMYEQFSNDFINQYLFDAPPVKNRQEAKEIIEFYLNTNHLKNHRYILINEDNQKIGTIGFHSFLEEEKSISIGYDLKKEFNKQGYMAEALEELLKYLKEELHVHIFEATIYPSNEASKKLVEKFNFIPYGKKIEIMNDVAYEHIIYRLKV